MKVYLDYNATARPRPEAIEAAARALGIGANPSSVHADGRTARQMIELARDQVGALVGASSQAVAFVSGGAEANALAIFSAVRWGADRILLGATEHDTVRRNAEESGVPVETWPVLSDGRADLDWLVTRLRSGGRPLVCLMAANNETGVIQPVSDAARLVAAADGWLHVDAVQAAGKILLSMEDLGADTLSLSAHKLGGPQGAAALVAGERAQLHPLFFGGGQESGLRAGTENLSGIAGFGAAAAVAQAELARIELGLAADGSQWRDELAAQLCAQGAQVLGAAAPRLSQTLCIAAPGHASEVQVMALDLAGVMVSAGAACSSGRVEPSRVASAMGRSDLAGFQIRVSGGWASTDEDWRLCAEAWLESYERHRRVASSTRAQEFA
ncbi:MAG: cysteine desulfurase family protein [Caulobacteraceae bacterium]